MLHSWFVQCSTSADSIVGFGHGRSRLPNQTVTIDHCKFCNNSAEYGAVLMVGDNSSSDFNISHSFNIFNSEFNENSGNTAGGAFTTLSVCRVSVVGCTNKNFPAMLLCLVLGLQYMFMAGQVTLHYSPCWIACLLCYVQ